MIELKIDPAVAAAAPSLQVMAIEADVVNPPTGDALWAEIGDIAQRMAELPIDQVNKQPAIAATRQAYKALGKEPNRYRPSAEALCRRVIKGQELYRTLAIIDLINYVSMWCGHSIGGFDADRIEGGSMTLGVGREGEPYEAIGRGQLNIAGMPVWRDSVGGVGTPTSDNDRTKLTEATRRVLITVNMYGRSVPTAEVEAMMRRMLSEYASATNVEVKYIKP